MSTRRRISREAGERALEAWSAAHDSGAAAVDRQTEATAVRYCLEELAARHPGNAVEVRVPPFGVAQCIPGPRHTRGTPPTVVEARPQAWLELATGRLGFTAALAAHAVEASGVRSDLSGFLPLFPLEGADAQTAVPHAPAEPQEVAPEAQDPSAEGQAH